MNKKGFTLIEILFALAIIGVIAAISIAGLRANIKTNETEAFSKKALHAYSSAIYEVMNVPTSPDSFRCEYALEYISQGTITSSTATQTFTTGDGILWSCNASGDTVTVTFPNSAGSCTIVTNDAGVITSGTCGDLSPDTSTSGSSTGSGTGTGTQTGTTTPKYNQNKPNIPPVISSGSGDGDGDGDDDEPLHREDDGTQDGKTEPATSSGDGK